MLLLGMEPCGTRWPHIVVTRRLPLMLAPHLFCFKIMGHWLCLLVQGGPILVAIIIILKTSRVRPRGYKTFFMLNSTEHEFQLLIKLQYRRVVKFLSLSLSDVVFIMLINDKVPTIVSFLTFMSRINFVLK